MSDPTGRGLVEHWDWASQKGLMNAATAKTLEGACRRVLEDDEDWEALDVTTLDIDQLLNRFKKLHAIDFKPRSLSDYEHRFRRAIASYKKYLADPSSWTYRSRNRRSSISESARAVPETSDSTRAPSLSTELPSEAKAQEYSYPFRPDFLAKLVIPRDAKSDEIARLTAWVRTLATDYKPAP